MINIKLFQKCSICGCPENESPKFYYNSSYGYNLCNKHYLQLRRHGKIFDDKPNIKIKEKCEICGDKGKLKICYLEGMYYTKTLCIKHHTQIHNGNILDSFPSHKYKKRICEICDSDNDVHYYRKTNQMLCRKHYTQMIDYGKILDITVFDKNQYEIREDKYGKFAEVILRNSKNKEVARTNIDLDDLHRVIEYKWRYEKVWGYASKGNTQNNNYIMMQNFILNHIGMIDHIDRNPLNNRKYNLIPSNKSLNALNCGLRSNNSSGVTGVSFNKRTNLWRSYINWEGERIELGYYHNIEDAIYTRLIKEKELLGELAPQRNLFEEYGVEMI